MLFISFLWFSLVLTTSGFRQFPDRLKGCRKGISCLMKKKTNRFQPQDTTPSTRPVVKSVPDPVVGNAYEIELPKLAGIDWGADLSFRWVKVIGFTNLQSQLNHLREHVANRTKAAADCGIRTQRILGDQAGVELNPRFDGDGARLCLINASGSEIADYWWLRAECAPHERTSAVEGQEPLRRAAQQR